MVYSLFIDSDIILDELLARSPFKLQSHALFVAESQDKLILYTTASIVLNVHYIAAKLVGKVSAREAIQRMLLFFKICVTTQHHLEEGFNSDFLDVEDAIQYYSAVGNSEIDFFISRNIKHYKYANKHLKVISPTDFLALM